MFALAGRINSRISISQEQINEYVKNKKELQEKFSEYEKILEIMDYLDNSGVFSYKINTSNDYEIPHFSQDYLKEKENPSHFLDDLFTQSIYYVTPSGSSLRIKLFEIKSGGASDVIQPTMEQIFYNKKMVDYTDKKVIKFSDFLPDFVSEQNKFVFEIASPEFRKQLLIQRKIEASSVKSRIGTITDEGGIYVNVPEGAVLHSGERIVGVKKLKE